MASNGVALPSRKRDTDETTNSLYNDKSTKWNTLSGVTSNLIKRVYEHKADIHNGFSKKYGCKHLVFYELYETMEAAIHRETQINAY